MSQKNTTPTDALRQFADAIYSDLGAVIYPKADGELHRFDDPEGRRKNSACWYVLHLDGFPAGVYGSWRTGYRRSWRARPDWAVTKAEQARTSAEMQAAKTQRDALRAEAQATALHRAGEMWGQAGPARPDHPYLVAKRVYPHGIRQSGDLLLVPLRSIDGDLVSLQTIRSDGTKRFIKGAPVTSSFCLIGTNEIPEAGELYITEGVATAATVCHDLGLPVAAAMYADNLTPVAMAIRRKYPRLAIVIAADNDHCTPGNPGIAKTREAAKAVHGTWNVPAVCLQHDCSCTDFNDTSRCERLRK